MTDHRSSTPLSASPGSPTLSVIAPAHNEQENVAALAEETRAALDRIGVTFEMIIVDDGSTDRTRAVLQELKASRPWLRCIAMQQTPPGKGHGQSAAFAAGIRAARGALIATMDADLQNDPGDLPMLLEQMRKTDADLVQGDRSRARKDNFVRRMTSRIGRVFRRMILGDRVRDTGCSLRIMKADVARRLPLEFKGIHRFVPVSVAKMGFRVVEVPVNHRARVAGTTKYGLGIWQRAWPGLMDCFAVRWMSQRRRPTASAEIVASGPSSVVVTPAGGVQTLLEAEGAHA